MTLLAVVRVRGRVGVRGETEETLRRLRLTRVNHCVVVEESETIKGMLQKAKDYITWGEIKKEVLEELIEKKGELIGGKKPEDPKKLADEIWKGEKKPNILKPFRLHPPSGGYERGGIKAPYTLGGALGYRGEAINDLLRRMM